MLLYTLPHQYHPTGGGGGGGANGIKWHKMETFSMEKMEKPLSNSPFMPFYAMNFDHRNTYVAAYLDTLTCLFSHNRLLKAHTKLLEAHTRLLETHTRLYFRLIMIRVT